MAQSTTQTTPLSAPTRARTRHRLRASARGHRARRALRSHPPHPVPSGRHRRHRLSSTTRTPKSDSDLTAPRPRSGLGTISDTTRTGSPCAPHDPEPATQDVPGPTPSATHRLHSMKTLSSSVVRSWHHQPPRPNGHTRPARARTHTQASRTIENMRQLVLPGTASPHTDRWVHPRPRESSHFPHRSHRTRAERVMLPGGVSTHGTYTRISIRRAANSRPGR